MPDDKDITILAVDDNDSIRYSLSRNLRGGGYKVVEARTGAEALRLAETSPDLITLDVHLPDTDGFEICRRLRANPKTAHIPVLHISATFVEPEYRVRGLQAADGYLAEPFSREELLATVGALLRVKSAEQQARLHAAEAERVRQDLEKSRHELEDRVRQRTAELASRNEEIRELTGRLLKLQDDERRRIARELHDSTGQMLTAMKMHLDRLNLEVPGLNKQPLMADVIAMNEDLNRQLRTMSYLLHPPLLDEIGLASALTWYIDGFARRSGLKVDLQIDPEFERLPDDMEIAIFRVVQECLTNIHRHSGSPTAAIRVEKIDNAVYVEVVDTGRGVPEHKLRGDKILHGIGLMGIEERIRQFDGQLVVSSSDKGTTIKATLPLEAST